MSEKKICPLLSIATMQSKVWYEDASDCLRDRCQWWKKGDEEEGVGDCAIMWMAGVLALIAMAQVSK